ncbi:MAG: hypothetical protein K9J17_15230 [Flavobacteriales bacterium]|nr:hypothetical protein [Flavobacteriales bacterium]
MSFGIPSMFKTPRHRSFDYKPVIYDQQKERKEELKRLVEEQQNGELSDERRRELLRGKLSKSWSSGGGSVRKTQSSAQSMRLVLIVSFLFGLVWFFFNWG